MNGCAICGARLPDCDLHYTAGRYYCDPCVVAGAAPRESRAVGVVISNTQAVIETPTGQWVVDFSQLKGAPR